MLGADLLFQDYPLEENLRLSAAMFYTLLMLLMLAFSALIPPTYCVDTSSLAYRVFRYRNYSLLEASVSSLSPDESMTQYYIDQ